MPASEVRRHSLSTMLRRSAERSAARPALRCGNVQWSYRELDDIVDRLANGLVRLGVAKGDRIAILARNSHAFVALRFAVARAAAVLVPINFMLRDEEVRYILEDSGARMLFVDETTAEVGTAASAAIGIAVYGIPGETTAAPQGTVIADWDDLQANADPLPELAEEADLAQIIYTSGTESRPKGVMLSHSAILWQYQSCIVDCEWTRNTTALHALPLFHCAQLDAMLGPSLNVGGFNIITDGPAPGKVIDLLEKYGCDSFFAPPTIWIALLRMPQFTRARLPRLSKAYYGASIMPRAIIHEIEEKLPGLRLWNLYGQTEIAPVATVLFPEEHKDRPGSAGRPALHVSTRVIDDEMRDVAPGEVGEIVHRSPHLMTAYWGKPDLTADALAGGWFHSGDLATIDAEGFITIVDRKKDVIKTGGENVASREVEEVIYTHPAVIETAVVGVKDPRWIEAVTAAVVVTPGASLTQADIIKHCAERLAAFKVPKRIVFVETLPRNASGKILKRELREVLETEEVKGEIRP